MSRFLAALTVLVPSTGLAGALVTPVVGGTMAPPGKWPDAVAVLGPNGSCSGTLVAPDVVLTAGHCVDIHPDEVIADTTNYNGTGGTHVAVESITAYPDYKHSLDVAAIVLAEPIAVAPRPVGARCTFTEFTEEVKVHLVGFGMTQTDGKGTNTSLREAMAPVLDADCSGGNGCRPAAAPAGEFVAGGDGAESCYGDSGGPVYLDTERGPVVIGAVSRGLSGGPMPCGGAAIYVRTDKVLEWVEEVTDREIVRDGCDDATVDGSSKGSGKGSADARPARVTGCSAIAGESAAVWIVVPLGLMRRRRRAVR